MTKKVIKSINPFDNSIIGELESSSKQDIIDAYLKSKETFKSWKQVAFESRSKYLLDIKKVLKEKLEEVAKLQSMEMGKLISESISECNAMLSYLEDFSTNFQNVLDSKVIDKFENYQTEIHYEPFGVCAVIAPWNYPCAQLFKGVIQAILSGNTVIFKHSEECILTSKLIQDIFDSSSLPKGVFISIYGDKEEAKILLDQDINFISFTGSTAVGEIIYKTAAAKFIPTIIETGGSSPAIVYPDVDITQTCKSIYKERFSNCGQICCALKRLIVHQDVFDQVVAELVNIAKKQKLGNQLDKDTTASPLASKKQLEILNTQVLDAIEKGAKVEVGGEIDTNFKGCFYKPTILTNVNAKMKVLSEELFGPVLPIIKFKTDKEAIDIANDTEYGLSAFVYTNDLKKAEMISKEIKAGHISINGSRYVSNNLPFGGYKKSGISRRGGEAGFYNYSQIKVIAKPI